ncbi:hypothetical protein [Streptomyces adelaidensis]|uniref:hypothetical protein n=1 Tax=Streptomyces adelaidensis TaxID=2796465 RepID=UPI001905A6DE|nr:hypothetical protein [Streptomyces adelaidensis]
MGNRIARFFKSRRKRLISGPTVHHLGSRPARAENGTLAVAAANALARPWLAPGHEPGYRLQEARRHALFLLERERWT